MRRERYGVGKRTGTAVTELAVCIPVIALLVAGSIEATSMIFLKQSLTAAAYEGIRVASKTDIGLQEVTDRCNAVLAPRNVQGAQISVTPVDFESAPTGTHITVSLSAPTGSNRIIPTNFVRDITVTATAVMLRE